MMRLITMINFFLLFKNSRGNGKDFIQRREENNPVYVPTTDKIMENPTGGVVETVEIKKYYHILTISSTYEDPIYKH